MLAMCQRNRMGNAISRGALTREVAGLAGAGDLGKYWSATPRSLRRSR